MNISKKAVNTRTPRCPCQTDIFSMDMVIPSVPISTLNSVTTLGEYATYRQRAHAHRARDNANKEALRGLACQEWRLNNGSTIFHEAVNVPELLPLCVAGTEHAGERSYDIFGKKFVCGRCSGFYWYDWRTKQVRAHCGPDFGVKPPSPDLTFRHC